MWGTWFTITLGGTAGVVLLVIGLAFGGWPVLVAVAIFGVVAVALLAGAAMRRSGEYVERGDEGGAASRPERSGARAAHGSPRSGGAPASGEGG